jgi:predicted nucleotidyltransferase
MARLCDEIIPRYNLHSMLGDAPHHERLGIPAGALAELCRRHRLRELSVFGSVLRGDFTADSDIDLLIELEPGEQMTIERFLALKDELESLLGRTVDLVEKPLLRNPYRRNEILRTREVLYAA